MPQSGYSPSAEVVREHLIHVRQTIHLPRWQRGDFSLQLLLGLRDAAVDAELGKLVPRLDATANNDWELGAAALTDALADRSIRRITHLVSHTASALPLAWLTPTLEELRVLVSELPDTLHQHPYSLVIPPVVFASLCDLARRREDSVSVQLLEQLKRDRWLERVELAAASGKSWPSPKLIERTRPAWLPDLPPALIRDPVTGLLSRSVLSDDPHRFRLPDGSRLPALPSRHAILFDVDRMKHVLDVHGMRSGDGVLIAIAEHLQMLFGDRVIRFGGDEFLVAWEGDDLAGVARTAVDSVRSLSVSTFEEPKQRIAVTVSAGVGTGLDSLAALRAAEQALDRAKVAGRDRVGV